MSREHSTREISQPAANKPATVLWFLVRPSTYRHLVEMLLRLATPSVRRLERTGPEAEAWGGPLAVSPQQALTKLLGPGTYLPPNSLHPEVFEEAARQADSSGIGMGGAGNLDLLYHLVRHLEARRVVETGVAFGWSSLAVLLAQHDFDGGRLVSTDMPYPRADAESFVGCVVPQQLRENWTLIRQPDRPALPKALAHMETLDLVHYDSDKTYAGQSWAFRLIWKALRPGGVFIADDIQYQAAFRDFVASVGVEPVVVDGDGKLIGVVRKPV